MPVSWRRGTGWKDTGPSDPGSKTAAVSDLPFPGLHPRDQGLWSQHDA